MARPNTKDYWQNVINCVLRKWLFGKRQQPAIMLAVVLNYGITQMNSLSLSRFQRIHSLIGQSKLTAYNCNGENSIDNSL